MVTPPPSQTRQEPLLRTRRGLNRNSHDRLRRTTQAEVGRQRTSNNVADIIAPNDRNQTRIRQTAVLRNRQTQGSGRAARNVTRTQNDAEVRVAAREGCIDRARITRRDWMTLPLETLVERKFLGMSLQQSELRCTSNTVHYVFNQEHAEDTLLISHELVKLVLSKTPKFCLTPNKIKSKTVAGDCDSFGQRLIKTFNRFVCKDFIARGKVNSELSGVVPWKPKQFPRPMDYYARRNQDYFDTSKPSGYVGKTHHAICSGLEQFVVSFKQDTMQTAANIARRGLRIKQNLLPSERTTIRTTLNKNVRVGFNDSDKNFGPVLSSRDLYLELCRKHLFDGKGTYEYTEKPKDLILEDVTSRLKKPAE
jgi:hypothetical protein